MKIRYEGWAAFVEDFYAPDATDEEIQIIGNLLSDCTVVTIRGQQKMTALDDHVFSGRFGRHDLFDEVKRKYRGFYDSIMTSYPEAPSIARVTGAKNDEGMPGLHGHDGDLDWHCNKPHMKNRVSIAYLRSIHGSVGSRTSWINSKLAYDDLSDEWKERIKDVKLLTMSSFYNYSKIYDEFKLDDAYAADMGYFPSMVETNPRGNKTIHFPFLQMKGLDNVKDAEEEREIMDYIKAHMMQEKYMFHLDWQDGDINLADQWSGIHKRWAFAGMEGRLLHRIGHDYDNIKFVDNYLDGVEVIRES